MKLTQVWNVNTSLSSTPASTADFGVPALLVDHSDVPLDLVYRTVSQSSYATDLTASTDQVSWCASLWGQNYNPALAYIVRWISSASGPYWVRGPNYQTDIATWAAVTDGSLSVTSAAGTDAITAVDFTGDTTLADVAATIDAALVAGGLSGAKCAVDKTGRIYIYDPVATGSTATTLTVAGGGGGTDLYLPAWLDGANGWKTNGSDAEALATAMNRCLALTDDIPYAWHQRGGSVAEVTALSTAVNSLNKILHLRESDLTAKTATTNDFSYAISALSHARTYGIYTEHTVVNGAAADQNPDVVFCGEILPQPEGKVSYAMNALAGVSESGLGSDKTTVVPLTDGERAFLEGKSCDYLIKPSTITHARNGLSYGGQEMRVMVGRDWFNHWVMFDIYAYHLSRSTMTFSDRDLQAIKGIIIDRADKLVPLASSFTATEKATHTLTLSEVLTALVEVAINDGVITMSWAA
jgi:hypothetical protein